MSNFNFKESIKRNGKHMAKEAVSSAICSVIAYSVGTAVLVALDARKASKTEKKAKHNK